jgi:hypothetical protein
MDLERVGYLDAGHMWCSYLGRRRSHDAEVISRFLGGGGKARSVHYDKGDQSKGVGMKWIAILQLMYMQ